MCEAGLNNFDGRIHKPVSDALEVVAEIRAGEIANSDAVVDVESSGQEVAASLDESEYMKLIGGRQQALDVVGCDVSVTCVRVVDD